MATISCFCGTSRQMVDLKSATGYASCWRDVSFCHCYACRHLTGQLYASYVGIRSAPSPEGLQNMQVYSPCALASASYRHYFCDVCGCHVFRCLVGSSSGIGQETGSNWEVATGVVVDSPAVEGGQEGADWRHLSVNETGDGGLSIWLSPGTTSSDRPVTHTRKPSSNKLEELMDCPPINRDSLSASCHCGAISFSVTRPDPSLSTAPRSGFPDLTHPYCSTTKSLISNPEDVKWWLCSGNPEEDEDKGTDIPFPTHYLAGTCACRSCRLTSGFEIQSWAFVPRANILMQLPVSPTPSTRSGIEEKAKGRDTQTVPLTFSSLSQNADSAPPLPRPLPLRSYESSPGVIREFCPTCGASVFWHDKWRPDLIDVSVGLFQFRLGDDGGGSMSGQGFGSRNISDGARQESWLIWHKDRVSFVEDADVGRTGGCAEWARRFVGGLERGLKAAGHLDISSRGSR